MTQATDTDIRELKTAIDGNTRSIEALTKTQEANALAIAANTGETQNSDKIAR